MLHQTYSIPGALPATIPGPDRRRGTRHACRLRGTCLSATPDEHCAWRATVRNVSPGGMSLVVARWFEPGRVLAVSLDPPAGDRCPSLLAYVVHAHSQKNGDWVVGCAFTRTLSPTELRLFL